jgi:hypothetical protein
MKMNEPKGFIQYKKTNQLHGNPVVRKYFDLYGWFWFHTEFWIQDLEDRRPYTFIMRDWIFPHMGWFYLISVVWYAGILAWVHWEPYPAAVVGILSALVWAHLRWGAKWIEGEQEWPPYLGK